MLLQGQVNADAGEKDREHFFSEGQLVLPFRQGESSRFTPQNEFCGYEDSAFQAEKTFAVEAFNPSPSLCLKGRTIAVV